MVGNSLRFLLLLALGAGSVSAAPARTGSCSVVDAAKLPAEVGGSEALCRAVEMAVAARVPGLSYSVEVKVLSKSRLAAALVANGHALPEQNLAVSDRDLSRPMVERFAKSIAEALANSKHH